MYSTSWQILQHAASTSVNISKQYLMQLPLSWLEWNFVLLELFYLANLANEIVLRGIYFYLEVQSGLCPRKATSSGLHAMRACLSKYCFPLFSKKARHWLRRNNSRAWKGGLGFAFSPSSLYSLKVWHNNRRQSLSWDNLSMSPHSETSNLVFVSFGRVFNSELC